jgi:hypothetical protein
MSQDATIHFANVEKGNRSTVSPTSQEETEVDSFAFFEKVLQRPSGAEMAANAERLAVLAQEFRDKQAAIRRQRRKEQTRNIIIIMCPIFLAVGLWYWYWL